METTSVINSGKNACVEARKAAFRDMHQYYSKLGLQIINTSLKQLKKAANYYNESHYSNEKN